MTIYSLRWSSSARDRYETDMCEKARAVIRDAGYRPLTEFGGSNPQLPRDDRFSASNTLLADLPDEAAAHRLADEITMATGYPAMVSEYTPEGDHA